MNKYYKKINNEYWVHRPQIKIIINPILRIMQWYTDYPYVIASNTKFINDDPVFLGFVFKKVKLL